MDEGISARSESGTKDDGKPETLGTEQMVREGSDGKGPEQVNAPMETPSGGTGTPIPAFLSRVDIVDLLVKKHTGLVAKYTSELSDLDQDPVDLIRSSEEERTARDAVNKEVAEVKERRMELKERNKVHRNEFFDLMKKEEQLSKHSSEIDMYYKAIDDLDWKLATEAITLETERRLMDELKDTIKRMRALTDGYTPNELRERLNVIERSIASNLMQIEEHHMHMLDRVKESNVHHERFLEAQKKLKERESRIGWLKRRIELHGEIGKFWEAQVQNAKATDEAESRRTVESIRDTLLKAFEERETRKGRPSREGKDEKEERTPPGKGPEGKAPETPASEEAVEDVPLEKERIEGPETDVPLTKDDDAPKEGP